MRRLRAWGMRFLGLFIKARRDREFAAELESHLQLHVDDNLKAGMSAEEARRQAFIKLGGVEIVKERYRDRANIPWAETLLRDIRYAVRTFRRTPVFACTVIATIGLAVGLNTALFTAFNAFVLRPFAVRDPFSLYSFSWRTRSSPGHAFTWTEFQAFAAQNRAFSDVFAFRPVEVPREGDTLLAQLVTGNYFDVIGTGPALGRTLVPTDTAVPGGDAVIVLSDSAWHSRFGGDPNIVGRKTLLRGHPFTIVGVARPDFSGVSNWPPDFWAPVTMYHQLIDGPDLFGAAGTAALEVTGRLRPGVTPPQARAGLFAWAQQFTAGRPLADRATSVNLPSSATFIPLTPKVLVAFAPAFVALGLVLLLACANVANMMLGRALDRQREISVRLALGAGVSRVVRQLLTESLLLALSAGALGLWLGWVALQTGLRMLFAVLPSEFTQHLRLPPVVLDGRVFTFALAAAGVATLGFGLVPAMQARRIDLLQAIRGTTSRGLRPSLLRNGLMVCQIGVCVVLLICTGVLLRAGQWIRQQDVGLDVEHVLDIRVRGEAVNKVAERVKAEPDVSSLVVVAWQAPLYRSLPTIPIALGDRATSVAYSIVSPQYFDLLHVPLLRGRNFTAGEADAEAPVAIVSAMTARGLWPGADALGQTIRIDAARVQDQHQRVPKYASYLVIGVVRDVINGWIADGPETTSVYFPTGEGASGNSSLLVRVNGDPESVRKKLYAAFEQVAPGAVEQINPMNQVLAIQSLPFRVFGWISSFLGSLALVLTIAGIYGVISYLVSQRTTEIGIRMALGATAGDAIRMVLRESAKLTVCGISVGVLVALGLSRVLSSQLQRLVAYDSVPYLGGVAVVLVCAVAASLVPALRSSRVDPIVVLRCE